VGGGGLTEVVTPGRGAKEEKGDTKNLKLIGLTGKKGLGNKKEEKSTGVENSSRDRTRHIPKPTGTWSDG